MDVVPCAHVLVDSWAYEPAGPDLALDVVEVPRCVEMLKFNATELLTRLTGASMGRVQGCLHGLEQTVSILPLPVNSTGVAFVHLRINRIMAFLSRYLLLKSP